MVMRVASVGPLCCLHVCVPALSLCMRLLRELSCCFPSMHMTFASYLLMTSVS